MVFFFLILATEKQREKRMRRIGFDRSRRDQSEGLSEILLAFFSTKVSSRVCVCFSTTMMMMTMMMMMMMTTTTLACVVLRLRIANRLVKGSC